MATNKSGARDKIRHSAGFSKSAVKKNGAGGKGSWGNPENDYLYVDEDMHALDSKDPNYDEESDEFSTTEWAMFEPSKALKASRHFLSSLETSKAFKHTVRKATLDFFTNHDIDDFEQKVLELKAPELNHEIAKIAVSSSFDMDDVARFKVSELLRHLSSNHTISRAQMEFSFRRLYNHLTDLVLDVPHAHKLLNEFALRGVVAGYVDGPFIEALQMCARASLDDPINLKHTKSLFNTIISEYFSNEELDDAVAALNSENCSSLHHEFVKIAVYRALDRSNRECQLVSELLAFIVGDIVSRESCESAFETLIDRVEDLHNDCPTVLPLLANFLARAVTDECVTPAFLQRLPLQEGDMGLHVLRAAASLLEMPHAASRLSHIWGSPRSYEDLKQAVADIVTEVLSTSMIDEALRCISELGAPMYRHELVKRVFVCALDHGDNERQLAQQVIHRVACDDIGQGLEQVRKGLIRIEDELGDLCKDVPKAEQYLSELKHTLQAQGHKV